MRIKTPAAGEQALAAKHLVDAGDAAVKLMARVEDGSVGVGNLGAPGKHRIEARAIPLGVLHGSQKLDGAWVQTAHCPSRPPTKCAVRSPKRNSVSRSATMLSSLPV